MYEYLKNKTKWEEGAKIRKEHTRSAAEYTLEDCIAFANNFPEVNSIIPDIIDNYSIRKHCECIFANYYKDGNDWTPNCTQPGITQIVISLGGSRTFIYNKKEIPSNNGDVFVFGSAVHGIPKEPTITTGSIYIALFMTDGEDAT
jgi:hypothetical protein